MKSNKFYVFNCSNEGSDCLTVNISEDFIREALNILCHWFDCYWEKVILVVIVCKNTNIVETAWLNDIIVEVGKTVLQSKLYRAIISTTNELLEGIKLSFLSNVDDDHVYNLIHLLYNHVPFLQNNDELCARVSAVIQRLQNSTAISLWHKLLMLTKNFKLYYTNVVSMVWNSKLIIGIKKHLKTSFQHIRTSLSIFDKVNEFVSITINAEWYEEEFAVSLNEMLVKRDAFLNTLYLKRTNGVAMIDNETFFCLSSLRDSIVNKLDDAVQHMTIPNTIKRGKDHLQDHTAIVYKLVVEYVSGMKGNNILGRSLLWEQDGSVVPSTEKLHLAIKNLRMCDWRNIQDGTLRLDNLLDASQNIIVDSFKLKKNILDALCTLEWASKNSNTQAVDVDTIIAVINAERDKLTTDYEKEVENFCSNDDTDDDVKWILQIGNSHQRTVSNAWITINRGML